MADLRKQQQSRVSRNDHENRVNSTTTPHPPATGDTTCQTSHSASSKPQRVGRWSWRTPPTHVGTHPQRAGDAGGTARRWILDTYGVPPTDVNTKSEVVEAEIQCGYPSPGQMAGRARYCTRPEGHYIGWQAGMDTEMLDHYEEDEGIRHVWRTEGDQEGND